jgi:4-hydroxybenzoate polyprenyltransferase
MSEFQKLAATLRIGLWPGILANSVLFAFLLKVDLVVGAVIGGTLSAVAAFGFLMNDFVDRDIDRANDVTRWMAHDQTYARAAAVLLLWIAAGVAWLFANVSAVVGVAALAVLATVVMYSVILHRYPLVKNVSSAVPSLSPVWMMGLVALDRPTPPGAAFTGLCLGLILLLLAREIRLDEYHSAGDAAGGRTTVPHLLGATRTRGLELSLITLSIGILSMTAIVHSVSTTWMVAGCISAMVMGGLLAYPLHVPEEARFASISRSAMYVAPIYAWGVL